MDADVALARRLQYELNDQESDEGILYFLKKKKKQQKTFSNLIDQVMSYQHIIKTT